LINYWDDYNKIHRKVNIQSASKYILKIDYDIITKSICLYI